MSSAESIYSRWATPTVLTFRDESKLWTVHFDQFLKAGFSPILNALLQLNRSNGSTAQGRRNTVEQIWKLIHKVKVRIGEKVAWELMQVLQGSDTLK